MAKCRQHKAVKSLSYVFYKSNFRAGQPQVKLRFATARREAGFETLTAGTSSFPDL